MRGINRRITTAAALGAVLFGGWLMSTGPATTVDRPGLERAKWGQLPLRFEANLGQADPRVRFLSRGPGYTLFVTGEETVLSLAHRSASSSGTPAVRMRFAGGRTDPRITPGRELPGRSHYFGGGDRSRWRTGVPAYDRVTLEQIYDGIDLVFHGSQQQLEYDFIVAPGADPKQIALQIDGATGIRLDDGGNLVLRTGDVDLVQHKPVVYQDGAGAREPVDGAFVLGENGEVRFAVGAYDTARPLVIDPVVSLAFSSYLGGSLPEISLNGGIAVDRDGNVYVAGDTSSTNFPLVNPIQTDRPSTDIFVTKIAPDGSQVLYSTYIGGSAQEEAHDVAVNEHGELWVAGFSDSVDNPATLTVNEGFPTFNAFQPAFGGGIGDAIVLKLSAAGDALVFSSYLGGGFCPGCVINRSYERAHAMTLDEAGNAFLTGFTGSPSHFATAGAFQTAMGGPGDAWVAKITAAGAKERLTYLGGRGNTDVGYGVAVDRDGFVYVTGSTSSFDNAATPSIYEGFPVLNAFQPLPGGVAHPDAFVTKLTPDLSALVYSSYLGGNGQENGTVLFNGRAGGIAVDSEGHAWVAGHTSALNFPQVTPLRPRSGASELFITKVAPDGRSLVFSTYYGGPSNDFAQDLTIDGRDNVYIAAQAAQSFPVVNGLTPLPTSNMNVGAGFDAVAMKLSPAGAVKWATHLGGSSNDFAMSIAADDAGDAYVMGSTNSTNFPLQSPFQATCVNCGTMFNNTNAFVAKLTVPNAAPVSAADSYSVPEDGALHVAAPGVLGNDPDADGDPLSAELVSGPTAGALVLNANGSFDYTPDPNFNGSVTFTYRANDGELDGNDATVTIAVTPVNDLPSAGAAGPYAAPEGGSAVLAGTGSDVESASLTFEWDLDNDGMFETSGPAPTFSAAAIGGPSSRIVALRVTDGDGGSAIDTASVTIENVAPAAQTDTYAVNEDETLGVAAAGVLGNDADFDALTATLETGPANGQVTLNTDGSFIYAPNGNFHGTDTFVYRANDGDADSAPITVTLTVISVNDLPAAQPGGPYAVAEGASLVLAGSGSDVETATPTIEWDLDGDGMFETAGATPTFSAAAIGGPSSRTVGLRVTDDDGGSTIDTAIVTIENVAPTAQPDAYSVNEDQTLTVPATGVLGNDLDFDSLTAVLTSGPAGGQLTFHSDGSFTYAPNQHFNGTDMFVYRANDGDADSAPITVTLTVMAVNDLPSADAGGPYTVAEGGSLVLAGSSSDLETASPTIAWDLDGDGVFETAGSAPTFSAAAIGGPATRAVSIQVTDGDGATATDTAVITIENVAPVVQPDSYAVAEDAALTVPIAGVLGNDTDVDALSATLVSAPSHGRLTLNGGGSFQYAPDANFNGSDAFSYRASDGVVESEPVIVRLTVNPINDAPQAISQSIAASEGTAVSITLAGTDIDGDTLAFSIQTQPVNGTLSGAAPNLFYTPNAGFSGADSFTYTVSDGHGGVGAATVVVTVEGGRGRKVRANLKVKMHATPDPVKVSEQLAYRIEIENKGPSDASGVLLTHAWPPEAALISVVADQGSCSPARPIVCALGALPDGATAHVTVVVMPTRAPDRPGESPGTLISTAWATANEPDTGNTSATTKTKVTLGKPR
jgi:hypothetical protein